MIDNLETPFHYYRKIFVIFKGETRRYDNVRVTLFDNQLSIIEEDGTTAIFNFDNIIGVELL